MRSWVFRHRSRLRVIYGLPMPLTEAEHPLRPLPGEDRPPAPDRAGASGEARPPTPARKAKKVRKTGLEPGQVVRRGRYVVLAPMKPPGF